MPVKGTPHYLHCLFAYVAHLIKKQINTVPSAGSGVLNVGKAQKRFRESSLQC